MPLVFGYGLSPSAGCPAPNKRQLQLAEQLPSLSPQHLAAGPDSKLLVPAPPCCCLSLFPDGPWPPALISSSPWAVCRGEYKGVDPESGEGVQAALDQAGCLLDSPQPALHHGERRAAHQTKCRPPSPLLPSWRRLACHRAVSYTYAGGSLGRQEAPGCIPLSVALPLIILISFTQE